MYVLRVLYTCMGMFDIDIFVNTHLVNLQYKKLGLNWADFFYFS